MSSSDQITKKSGSNLALSFVSLPAEKQSAMSSFYAYCRLIDDIADSTELPLEEKARQLGFWRSEIDRAYTGTPESELGRELQQIARRYLIPPTPMLEVLEGVEMDLHQTRHANFESLYQYCYRVASAVGLVSIEIFEYKHASTKAYAVALGMAFQLTNILRDVAKDASFGRIYLPLDEMADFGVTEKEILEYRWTPEIKKLLHFQYHRATHYFEKAERLLHPDDRPNMIAAEIMATVYRGILEKAARFDFNVVQKSARLNRFQKAQAIWKTKRRPLPARVALPPQKVLVLGAGFAGISAAMDLSRRGHQVTLIEKLAYPGGRACSFRDQTSGDEIDNGQHILMGCYHETLRLLADIEVSDELLFPKQLRVPYLSPNGLHTLSAPKLPAPLHLLAALLTFNALRPSGKFSALQLGLKLKLGAQPHTQEKALVWLQRLNQTTDAIQAVWEPLCLAALNEPIATADAGLLATVIRRALLAGPHDATIILSKKGLSTLIQKGVHRYLTLTEGTLLYQTGVSSLEFSGDRCTSVLTTDGTRWTPDQVVSTLPWHALRGLLPESSSLANQCQNLPAAPLLNLHLWLDRPLIQEPFVGFLDSPIHWLFNSSQFREASSTGGFHHSIVISGGYTMEAKSSAEIEAIALTELKRLLPDHPTPEVKHRFLYRAKTGTLASRPEVESLRPGPKTEWKNFWLAGDWTATGLPGTIEGAVVSGQIAAKALDQS